MSENPSPPSPSPDTPPGRPPTKRRWIKRLARFVVVLVVLAGVGLLILTRPFVLTPLMSWQLSAIMGADVRIDRAQWRWTGGIELTGVTLDLHPPTHPPTHPLTHPPAADHANPQGFGRLLEIDRLDVALQPAALRRGSLQLQNIQIDAPILRIVEDPQLGTVNLRQWLFAPGDDTGEPGSPIALPEKIIIRDGHIRVERLNPDATLTTLGSIHIDGSLEPAPGSSQSPQTPASPAQRLILLQTNPAPGQPPLCITGRIDPNQSRMDLEVANFDLTQPLGLIASPQLRSLWNELDPQGALPTLRASFTGDGHGSLALEQAELVLKDLAITVPLKSLGLSDELLNHPTPHTPPAATQPAEPVEPATAPHDIRMTQVGGRFVVTDQTLHVEDFTGLLEGLRYHIDGSASLQADAALDLHVQTETFELPETPPFILRLPAAARKIYGAYQPRGKFRAAAHITRADDQPVHYTGKVELLGARVAYYKFPFPLHDLAGEITFDDQGLAFQKLRARGPRGGNITLTGTVTDPGPHANADVTIAFRDIPADEHLLDALQPPARQAVEMFTHQPSRQRLADRGLIHHDPQTPQKQGPNSTARFFPLNNQLTGTVHIQRDASANPNARVTTTLDTAGLNILFQHFPYPVTLTDGQLVIQNRHIQVNNLKLQGLGGLSANLAGQLTRESSRQPFRPDLQLTDLHAPINRFLRAALPDAADQWLQRLALAGNLHASVRVSANPLGKPHFHLDGKITDGTAQPFAGRFALTELAGHFLITPTQTQITRATARHDHAVIDLAATIQHPHPKNKNEDTHEKQKPPHDPPPQLRLTASATNLAIEPALADLIPPDVAMRQTVLQLFDDFKPAGRTDAQLALTLPQPAPPTDAPAPNQPANTAPTAPAPRVELTLAPDSFAATHAGHRVAATGITGRVHLAAGHARLDALRGELKQGWAQIDGTLALDPTSDTALLLSATLPADAPLLLAAVPDAANNAIAGLDLQGPIHLDAARLLIRARPDQRPAIEFDAAIEFHNNTATLGVPITDLTGTLDTAVRTFDSDRPTELRLELAAKSLRAADRRIAPLTGTLTNIEHPGWLAIERLTGRLYGGTLTAQGGVPLDGKGQYRIDANLQDTALGPFLEPLKQNDKPDNNPQPDQNENPNQQQQQQQPDPLNRSLATGILSANLVLEADLADPDSRRGRGALRIRDAKLLEDQGGIGALRALNFAAPTDQPLDRAQARFLVQGNRVLFDHLEMAGPGLQIAGKGTMTCPQNALDLTLFTRNPNAPKLGPISDFLDALKDELVAIRITGTLANPQTSVTSLSGTRNQRQPLIPLPPDTP